MGLEPKAVKTNTPILNFEQDISINTVPPNMISLCLQSRGPRLVHENGTFSLLITLIRTVKGKISSMPKATEWWYPGDRCTEKQSLQVGAYWSFTLILRTLPTPVGMHMVISLYSLYISIAPKVS